MNTNDMGMLHDKLNALADVYGKPHVTKPALGVWWETIKEFDHNAVFGLLGYWAKSNSRMPTPAEVWSKLNDKRTAAIEDQARENRAVNTGAKLPDGYAPTPDGRVMMRLLAQWTADLNRPRKSIWKRIIDAHLDGKPTPVGMLRDARRFEPGYRREVMEALEGSEASTC